MFILEPTMSNTFLNWSKLLLLPVVIDGESEYKISQIINSKIDYKCVYKLLYKVIWLEYKNIEEEFNWLPVSKLVHISNLISDFH